MNYTFEILGVTPVLDFFNHQQVLVSSPPRSRAEYLGVQQCTLDSVLSEVSSVSPERNWDLDSITQVIVDYWIGKSQNIRYWSTRLKDAGSGCLLVTRIADVPSLRQEFERIFFH